MIPIKIPMVTRQASKIGHFLLFSTFSVNRAIINGMLYSARSVIEKIKSAAFLSSGVERFTVLFETRFQKCMASVKIANSPAVVAVILLAYEVGINRM